MATPRPTRTSRRCLPPPQAYAPPCQPISPLSAAFRRRFAVTIPTNGIITASGALLASVGILHSANYHNPYVDSWNVAIQQDLPMQFNAQLSYVANHGTHLGVGQNINLASALNEGSAGYPLNIAFGKTASVTEDFLGYSTNYQSLQAQLNRHFTGDLGVTTSFTWGKGLNYAHGRRRRRCPSLLARSAPQLCADRL